MFEFSEEALDQIAVSVEILAEREALLAIALQRDIGEAILCFDMVAYSIAVIGLIAQEYAAFRDGIQQRFGLSTVTGLTFRQM